MLLAFACAYLAMLALCLAMPRHYKQLRGAEPSRLQQRLLRLAALLCLAGTLGLCVQSLGLEMGSVLWPCLLMVAALLLVTLLAWQPRWVLPTALALLLAGLCARAW